MNSVVNPVQLSLFPEPLSSYRVEDWYQLRWEKEDHFYEAYLHQDLWQNWQFSRRWGKIDGDQYQMITLTCANYSEALAHLTATARRRQHKGYRLVTPVPKEL